MAVCFAAPRAGYSLALLTPAVPGMRAPRRTSQAIWQALRTTPGIWQALRTTVRRG